MTVARVLLASGFLVTSAANALRAALPGILPERKDAAERRTLAISHLRVLWLGRFCGLVSAGTGIALASVLLREILHPALAALSLSILLFILAELAPSRIGHTRPDLIRKALSIPLFLLRVVFHLPARIILGPASGGEGETGEWVFTPPDFMWLEQRTEKSEQHSFLQERELMEGIVDFADKIVREVMVPRIDMVAMAVSDDLGAVLREAIAASHSRIPVYREKIDDIIGVLYVKDLLKVVSKHSSEPFRMEKILRQPYFVPEYKRVDSLFREFQSHRIHMAVVVDEYGGTAGLVTMEDLVEEVFGEILDEFEDSEAPMVQSLGLDSFRVDAMLPIDDLNDLLESSFGSDDFDTVGGLVYSAIGKIPRPGESVVLEGFRFTVERVRAQRILLVRVAPERQQEAAP